MKIYRQHIDEVVITEDSGKAEYYSLNNVPYIVHLNEKNRNESFPTGAFCVEDLNDIDDEFKEMVYRRCHNLPWEILETARLRLREITVEDVPRLYELYSDESITRYIEPLFADYAEEVEYTRSYIQNVY